MPGVTVNVVDAPAAGAGVAPDVSKWFVAGLAQKGSATAYEVCHSLAEFVTKCGTRQTYSYLYDTAEAFFREGGHTLIVGRVVGPAALQASHTFNDSGGTPAPALTVKALTPGDWGNGPTGLAVAITHPTTGFGYQVSLNGVVIESSPEFAAIADAITWAATNSSYVALSDPGAVGLPAAVTATNLTGGTDDRSSVTTPDWTAALSRLVPSLGPGQISAPGTTTSAIQQAVLDHAAANNRVAILDGASNATSSGLVSQAAGFTGEGRKHGCLVGPWAIVPGITSDTTRTIPYSGILAGIIARNDGGGATPLVDTAPAGDAGYSSFALDLVSHWDKATRDTLNTGGVIPARIASDGRVQTYGDRTLASLTSQRPWLELSSSRLFTYVVAECKAIGETFVFKPLDGANTTINRFGGELKAFLMGLSALGMIFNDPQTAVDVGPSVNTATTRSNRQLVANVTVQPAEAAEDVVLNIAAQAA